MKQLVLILLLMGGVMLTSYAQGRRGHGERGGHGRYERSAHRHGPSHYNKHHKKYVRYDRGYRGYYHGYRYVRPRPVPVVYAPVPLPPPPVYYRSRPGVVISTGPIVIGF